MKKKKRKSSAGNKGASENRMFLTTGDTKLDIEIAKATVKAVWEGGRFVYDNWVKDRPALSPLFIHVLRSCYLNKHHILTFRAKNVSSHGVYIEDIFLDDSMQIVAFEEGEGDPNETRFGLRDHEEGWRIDDTNLNPSPPFTNQAFVPKYLSPSGSVTFNCAIRPYEGKNSGTINFTLSPLAGEKKLRHREVFLLRDR